MITYTDRHQPKSISLEDVTSYIETLVKVSESESERLHAYARAEIKKQESKIRRKGNPYSRGDIRSSHSPLKFKVGWAYNSDRHGCLIKPWNIWHIKTETSLVNWVNHDLHTFDWLNMPQFKMTQGHNEVYPFVRKRGVEVVDPFYHIEIRDSRGYAHNERFPADFFYSPEEGIWDIDYYIEGNETPFWDIYDRATAEDKKILLRDWLPLENIE